MLALCLQQFTFLACSVQASLPACIHSLTCSSMHTQSDMLMPIYQKLDSPKCDLSVPGGREMGKHARIACRHAIVNELCPNTITQQTVVYSHFWRIYNT